MSTNISTNGISCHKIPVFSVNKLFFGYTKNRVVLKDINFELYPEQSIGLTGRNGSGKTTFFRCITGLEKIWNGEILLNGKLIKNDKDFIKFRRNVGFSVQNPEEQLFFATTLEDVMFGPLNIGLSPNEAEDVGVEWLAKVGLQGLERTQIAHLSGGQQKLLALAGIFAMNPAALLLDEPFNGLDTNAVDRICGILHQIQSAKVIVCHNEMLLRQLCPQIIRLQDGRFENEGNF